MANKHFDSLIERNKILGIVEKVDSFLVTVKGLNPIQINALVMFDDGSKGMVREIGTDHVLILHLGTDPIAVGSRVVLQHHELVTKVGKDFVGRVISVNGQPLDGKGAIAPDTVWPVFKDAPPLIERQALSDQLTTGVTLVDTLFPLLLGQRLAILGDSKAGKSTFLTQLANTQISQGRIVIYCLIAKRKSDLDDLLNKLEKNGELENAVIIVSTMFDSLITSYLAPYVACSMAEYLWQEADEDVVVIYDDLTSHAQVYREISLLSSVSPGRDSYPGDMFYAHSSLLERAGRLSKNGKTLTALPAVLVPGGDITTYLPTNIMSITDGQLIFDLDLFRSGSRPAISTGLSVSRVGGHGQSDIHKNIGSRVFKSLAKYNEAQEFAHFGSELAIEARSDLEIGERLKTIFNQGVDESQPLGAQQIMLEVVLSTEPSASLDMEKLKQVAQQHASEVNDRESFKQAVAAAAKESLVELKR